MRNDNKFDSVIILVFAHMAKTAGTSLSKHLIQHFGKAMHIVPGGVKKRYDWYGENELLKDLALFNNRLKIISGHPLRPYKNFGPIEKN
jgi:hypothetical protein